MNMKYTRYILAAVALLALAFSCKKEDDEETAAELLRVLSEREDIAVDYHADYERDTGYIHHIYDCEGL